MNLINNNNQTTCQLSNQLSIDPNISLKGRKQLRNNKTIVMRAKPFSDESDLIERKKLKTNVFSGNNK